MKRAGLLLAALLALPATGVKAQDAPTQSPGLDVVGFGYDVFGKYADMASKKRYRLFKLGEYRVEPIGSSSFNVPEGVFLEPVVDHRVSVVEGSSVRQYAKSLAATAGLSADGMFFRASVETNLSSSESGNTSRHYITYMDSNNMWRVSLDTVSIDRLRETLEPRARQDINKLPPEKLFEAYGTHYIASAYLGGRADFTSVSETSSKVSAQQIRVAVEAAYKLVSASASLDSKHQKALTESKTTTELRVTGGNAQYVNDIRDYTQYTKWADGIEKRPVLCDFDSKSLRPIWELADAPGRRQQLEAAFKKMLEQYPLPPELANLGALSSALYMVESKAKGTYWDMKGYHLKAETKGKTLQLYRKDRVSTDLEGADRFIKVIANDVEDGWVFLQPQHSPYVLGIKGGEKKPGVPVHLWDMKKTDPAVQFKMEPVPDEQNMYYLSSRATGLFLEPSEGNEIVQAAFTGTDLQKWHFAEVDAAAEMAPPANGVYGVRAVAGGKYWDMPGAYPQIRSGLVQVWDRRPNGRTLDRLIEIRKVDGEWYTLRPMHLKDHVLEAPSKQRLRAAKKNNSNAQLWKFEYAGEPNTWYLRNRATKEVIDLSAGRTNANGGEVNSWGFHGGDNQKWELFPVNDPIPALYEGTFYMRLKSHPHLYIDVSGDGDKTNKNGANVGVWTHGTAGDRKVRFVPGKEGDGLYYIQFQNGGRVLDQVDKNERGANVQLWDLNGNPDQRWFVIREGREHFRLQCQYQGFRYLDISGSQLKEKKGGKGANAQVWDKAGDNQIWQLIYADGPLAGKPFQGE